ncbi:MAG: glycolate oxidase subunit GlcF, partial [Rhodospirillaceae bacterium]|nr:glycolate oxidase subunit GlcF [Rhodospirillaceae bacterium]
GFCLATCPTYVILGNELDSPRGRIYQIRDMLEQGPTAAGKKDKKIVKHIDRCLSCLSCMTTCPSGVDYMHLVDHARAVIEKNHTRPLPERMLRQLLAFVLPNSKLFRLSLIGAKLIQPIARYMPGRLKALVEMAPKNIPPASPVDIPGVNKAINKRKMRVGLMPGCAQKTLNPAINEATVRLLTRLGCDVVVVDGVGCCGALVHHLGMEDKALIQARENVRAWTNEIESNGLDGIVINASGCGTTLKDYGHMLKEDPAWAEPARMVSELSKDVSEIIIEIGADNIASMLVDIIKKPSVAYHSACSMQHGQKLITQPIELLKAAGFDVREPSEPHLCCGSAGTYNIMQPEIAEQLGKRKMKNISATAADIIATGNIGCMVQLAGYGDMPIAHTVQLLDWATGGPKPL